jgi:hypothetical protein
MNYLPRVELAPKKIMFLWPLSRVKSLRIRAVIGFIADVAISLKSTLSLKNNT